MAGHELRRRYSPVQTLGHLPTCSEDCTVVIDASAGCGGVFPCNVSFAVTGATEKGYDFVSIWRVPNRSAPLAALSGRSNLITELDGTLAYNATHSSPTGMFLIRFTSDEGVTDAGWAASWRALPPPPPSPKYCTNRTLTAASRTVEDGSGALPYGNK